MQKKNLFRLLTMLSATIFSISYGISGYSQVQPTYYSTGTLNTDNYDYGDITVLSGNTLTIEAQNAVFGTIIVCPSAQLIISNSTVLMKNKIIVKTGNCNWPEHHNDPFIDLWDTQHPAERCLGGELKIDGSLITAYTNTAGHKWGGIEVWGVSNTAPVSITEKGHVYITKSTIKSAVIGIFTASTSQNNRVGGAIRATETDFINNDFGVLYYGTPTAAAYPISVPNSQPPFNQYMYELPLNGNEYFLRCNFDYNTFFVANATRLSNSHLSLSGNCKDIRVLGCTFDDHFHSTFRSTIGVDAYSYADFTVDNKYNVSSIFNKNTGTATSSFNNLWYGVRISGMTDLNRNVVMHSEFTNTSCAISAQGSFKPVFSNNTVDVPLFQTSSPSAYQIPNLYGMTYTNIGIILNGCKGYTVEKNVITCHYTFPLEHHPLGIYVYQSGPLPNTINFNTVNNACFNYYALGQNYDNSTFLSASTGLKFLCNTNTGSEDVDFMVSPYPSNSNISGIAGIQANGTSSRAQNIFAVKAYSSLGPHYNYYNSNCNPIKYFGSSTMGNSTSPGNRYNVTNVVGAIYSCFPKVVGPKFPSPDRWIDRFAQLETDIARLGAKPGVDSTDTATMQGYYDEYEGLVDSVLNHFYFDDTTGLHYDSLAYSLEKMNLNYNYKLLLAGAYKSMNRYQDAIDLLSSLNSSYSLTGLDADRVDNLVDIYKVLSNLYGYGDNLDSLSGTDSSTIYSVYDNDDYDAHNIAAGLLYRMEGLIDPIPFADVDTTITIRATHRLKFNDEVNIYPVPTKTVLNVRWMPGANEASANLQINDLLGKRLVLSTLVPGEQQLNVEHLSSGMYFITVTSSSGKLILQQKFIKE